MKHVTIQITQYTAMGKSEVKVTPETVPGSYHTGPIHNTHSGGGMINQLLRAIEVNGERAVMKILEAVS